MRSSAMGVIGATGNRLGAEVLKVGSSCNHIYVYIYVYVCNTTHGPW